MQLQTINVQDAIAGYTLVERLGAGGYGEVWKVDAPGGLIKAMKFVYGRLDDVRAAAELKSLGRIKSVRHPFLLSLERIEIVDGQLVIVTELADSSLKDRFDECRREGCPGIPRDELLCFLRDAADALDFMEQNHSLQHLDIKPENLLVLGQHVKVADFGLVKGVQETAASLVSGLTPIYAAPEVFDDRPSRNSDQYSLAIVYQEMLTGTLPFPGRTPAQLAAQHMNSRPRLSQLPDHDRDVIGRALSKNYEDRYPSCSELVAALSAGTDANGTGVIPAKRPATGAENDTATSASQSTSSSERPVTAPGVSRPAVMCTELFDGPDSQLRRSSRAERTPRDSAHRAEAAVDLPPLDLGELEHGLRPTLIVGIGGTAAQVLASLRARLQDRLGNLAEVPAVQMLLVDTDRRTLEAATTGDAPDVLRIHETLAVPLRRPEAYREQSGNMLRWLSRRWLYNVPRSLETEGIRPLGRLALVDHCAAVTERVRRALLAATSDDALAASAEATGLAVRDRRPRIFVVASVCGGTGSGMVIDVAYAIRGILSELELPDDGLCGVLTYSTDASRDAKDLAVANAYACLSELYHYNRSGGYYPGDAACQLPAFGGDTSTFEDMYMVNLGEDHGDQAFQTATDNLAQYLCLSIASSAESVFDRCRKESWDPSLPADERVRTFGLARAGGELGDSRGAETSALVRDVLNAWAGRRAESRHRRGLAEFKHDVSAEIEAEPDTATPQARPEEFVDEIELAVQPLVRGALEEIDREFGGPIDRCICELAAGMIVARRNESGDSESSGAKFLEELDRLLGPRKVSAASQEADVNEFAEAVARFAKQHALGLARSIREWTFETVNREQLSLASARQTFAWFRARVVGLREDAIESLRQLRVDMAELQPLVCEHAARPSRASRSWLRIGQRRAARATDEEQRVKYGRLRLLELAMEGVVQLLQSCGGQISRSEDGIAALQSQVVRLADELSSGDTAGRTNHDTQTEAADISKFGASVRAAFEFQRRNLVRRIDRRMREGFLDERGGLCALQAQGSDTWDRLPTVLRREAAAVLRDTVRQIDTAAIFLESADETTAEGDRLAATTRASRPQLAAGGGSRRLFVTVPDGGHSNELAELVRASMQPSPTVIPDADRDVVVCCEMQGLSLRDVAARLVADRPDYKSVARRIHTRVDIEWSTLSSDE